MGQMTSGTSLVQLPILSIKKRATQRQRGDLFDGVQNFACAFRNFGVVLTPTRNL